MTTLSLILPQLLLSAHPNNLSYQTTDNQISIHWTPPSGPYNETEILKSYIVSCHGSQPGRDRVVHTLEVVTEVTIWEATIAGLDYMKYNYSCCVYAEYQTYQPRICSAIYYESMASGSELTSSSTELLVDTAAPDTCGNEMALVITSSVLGVVIAILFMSLLGMIVYFSMCNGKGQTLCPNKMR